MKNVIMHIRCDKCKKENEIEAKTIKEKFAFRCKFCNRENSGRMKTRDIESMLYANKIIDRRKSHRIRNILIIILILALAWYLLF